MSYWFSVFYHVTCRVFSDFVLYHVPIYVTGVAQVRIIVFWNDKCFLVLIAADGVAVFGDVILFFPCPTCADKIRVVWKCVLRIVPISFAADNAQIVSIDVIPDISVCPLQHIPSYLVVCINAGRALIKTIAGVIGELKEVQLVVVPHIMELQPDVLVRGIGIVFVRQFDADGIAIGDKVAQYESCVAVFLADVGIQRCRVEKIAGGNVVGCGGVSPVHAPPVIAVAAHQTAVGSTHQSIASLYVHPRHGAATSPMIAS